MANPAPQMPLHGTQNAPKFDGKTLALLPRFLEDVNILGTAAGITDLEKICAAIRYADLKEAEGWELLDEVTANPLDWVNFTQAVKKLYPGCEGTNRYCWADIQYLVQEFRAKLICTLEDLGEYQHKFLKIAQILINSRKLSDLDWDALFLSSLPANLETQVRQRLLITKSTHHPSDPYPIADIIEATQFLLTGFALHPLLAAPAAGMPPSHTTQYGQHQFPPRLLHELLHLPLLRSSSKSRLTSNVPPVRTAHSVLIPPTLWGVAPL